MKEDLNKSSEQQKHDLRKFIWIPILCMVVIILLVVIHLVKDKPSETNTPTASLTKEPIATPAPSPVKLQKDENGYSIITDEVIGNFQIRNVPNVTMEYLRGAATGQITYFQLKSSSIAGKDVYTAVLGDQLVICGGPSILSKDKTKILLPYDSILMCDIETETSQSVSSNVYEGKTAQYFHEISFGDGFSAIWNKNVMLSEDNSLIAYESNRRTYEAYVEEVEEARKKDEYDPERDHVPFPPSDIWIVDLATREEYLLLENAYVSFWVGRSLVYKPVDFSSDAFHVINIDTKEIKKLPDTFTTLFQNTHYLSTLEDSELRLYNVKTDKSYHFSLAEEGMQVSNKEIFTAEDGKDYAVISYRSNNKGTNGYYQYYWGVIQIETGNKNIYVLPDSINQRDTAPSIQGIVENNKFIMQDHRYSSYTDYFLINLGE